MIVKKIIKDFPDYCVTSDGRVWSNKRCRGKVTGWMGQSKLNHNHMQVVLCKNGKRFPRQVHRLILEAFVGPCPLGMECCHNDGNPANNNASNLRWDTRKSNHRDMVLHGSYTPPPVMRGEKNNHNVLLEEQVRIIFHAYHDGAYSSPELALAFGVDRTTISKIITKKNWRWLWQ